MKQHTLWRGDVLNLQSSKCHPVLRNFSSYEKNFLKKCDKWQRNIYDKILIINSISWSTDECINKWMNNANESNKSFNWSRNNFHPSDHPYIWPPSVQMETPNRNYLWNRKEKLKSFPYYFDALVCSIEKLSFFETDFEIVLLQVLNPYGHSILRSA